MLDSSKRRVKIVCTLGPACADLGRVSALVEAGMDVARLNFSHGTHDFHRKLNETVRKSEEKTGQLVAVMQDLQGPKIRLGKLDQTLQVKTGEVLRLYPEGDQPSTTKKGYPIPISKEIAKKIASDVRCGSYVLFDDGKISSIVAEVSGNELVVEVKEGGALKSHKGMNLPGTPLSIEALTEKDLKDLKLGLDLEVDAIALSFVRSAKDVTHLKKEIRKISNHQPLIFSKIEREEGIEDLDSIIDVSDGILIARGDMATELGAERVPVIQKMMIDSCNQLGVPIITATQMLESMISSPTPTRAEASDVANAVFDGTDAVMLSSETASGKYPIQSVEVMAKVILGAEEAIAREFQKKGGLPLPGSTVDSIEYSASKIANHVGASAIACITHSGRAARTLAKYRPDTPILAIMDRKGALRKLSFVWGVEGCLIPEIKPTDDLFLMIEEIVKQHNRAEDGDLIVITAGIPTLRRGTTNTIKVHHVGAPIERGSSRKF